MEGVEKTVAIDGAVRSMLSMTNCDSSRKGGWSLTEVRYQKQAEDGVGVEGEEADPNNGTRVCLISSLLRLGGVMSVGSRQSGCGGSSSRFGADRPLPCGGGCSSTKARRSRWRMRAVNVVPLLGVVKLPARVAGVRAANPLLLVKILGPAEVASTETIPDNALSTVACLVVDAVVVLFSKASKPATSGLP